MDTRNIPDIKDGLYFPKTYGCISLTVCLLHTHKDYDTAIDYLVTNLSFQRLGLARYMFHFVHVISITQLNNARLNLYSPDFNFAYYKSLGFTEINNFNDEVNKKICSYFNLFDEPCHEIYDILTINTLVEMRIKIKSLAVTKYLDAHIKIFR